MLVAVHRCHSAAEVMTAAASNAAWRRRVFAQPPRPPEPPPAPPRPVLHRPQREPWERPATPALPLIGVLIREILARSAVRYGVSVDDIVGRCRLGNYVKARHVAMFLMREMTGLSLPRIAKKIGGRDHTTILAACRRVQANDTLLAVAEEIRTELQDLGQPTNEGEAQ